MLEIGTIPAQHSAHTLLGTIAWLRESPETRRVRPRQWPEHDYDLVSFLKWFRDRLNEKINTRGSLPIAVNARRWTEPGGKWLGWRKLDSDWQRAARQTAQAVNTPRLVVRWVPLEFRARLAHRLES